MIRFQLAVLLRTRAALAPAAAFLFVLLGVYAYRDSGVGPTYAFTALSLCPIVAWLAATLTNAAPRTIGGAVVAGALAAVVQAVLALAAGDALRRRAA